MSVDTINDVLGASIDGPNGQLNFSFVDNFKTLADQPGLFQFGLACPDFDLCLNSPPAWLNDRGDCARHEEEAESHVVSSVDRDPPTNGDQALSPSSDSSNSSDLFFLSCSTPPSSVPSIPQDPFWDDKKNTSFTNGGGEAMDVAMDLHGSSFSFLGRDCESISRERGRDLSLVNPNFSEPTMAQGGSTPTQNAPAGWTYRQVLEVVAFPPPGAPHLWNAKVSQLTAELGMPSGSTGTDIVTFVMRIAIMKNELDKVTPLIKAFAAASRVLEGRVAASGVLGSIVHSLYAGPTYMGLQPAGADQTATQKGYHDTISESSESTPLEQQTPSPPLEEEEMDDYEDNDDEPTFPGFTEEDLYCRVGDCLWAFRDPRVCAKHRLRHFSGRWVCPGPCREASAHGGRFSRDETLKRHLSFPKNEACRKAVLEVLNLQTFPTSGTAWLAPFCDGPERPWESLGFQLTDLKTVKEEKLKHCDSDHTALPVIPTRHRRRYK